MGLLRNKKGMASELLYVASSFPSFFSHPPTLPPHPSSSLSLQLLSAMIEKMGDQDDNPLPQETMDGCESDEWSD